MKGFKLSSNGPEISPLGFGCFGLSNAYGPVTAAEAIATIVHALDLGCNLLDTADSYGAGRNEGLVGRAIHGRRHEVVLATKFGFVPDEKGRTVRRNGSPAHVYKAVDASLRRLGTEYIDIYTLHRVDPDVAIEETVGAMAKLVKQGKVLHLGLSEASAEQVRRAHAVHPISTLQSEYSLWTRDPECELLPLCRDLGIIFVAFAPLGRGIFSGAASANRELNDDDFRKSLPRFEQHNLLRTMELIRGLEAFAKRKSCAPAQIALAWILHKGQNIAAIPGTRRQKHLEENLGALHVGWTPDDSQALDELFSRDLFFDQRYPRESIFGPG